VGTAVASDRILRRFALGKGKGCRRWRDDARTEICITKV